MSESQLQKRRIGLEAWLVDVLSVRVVYNAQPVELFLQREGASANSFSTSTSKQIELPGFRFTRKFFLIPVFRWFLLSYFWSDNYGKWVGERLEAGFSAARMGTRYVLVYSITHVTVS